MLEYSVTIIYAHVVLLGLVIVVCVRGIVNENAVCGGGGGRFGVVVAVALDDWDQNDGADDADVADQAW